MTNWKKLILFGLLCASLAACGGGDSSDGRPKTFIEQRDRANQFATEIRSLNAVAPTDLPTAQSATYSGNVGVSLTPASLVFFGDLSLNVDFNGNTVTGNVSNVVDINEQQYSGQFQLENGEVDRTANAEGVLTADMTGTVTASGGDTLGANASLTGGFFGDNASHVSGGVDGTIFVNGTSTSITNGAFLGRR